MAQPDVTFGRNTPFDTNTDDLNDLMRKADLSDNKEVSKEANRRLFIGLNTTGNSLCSDEPGRSRQVTYKINKRAPSGSNGTNSETPLSDFPTEAITSYVKETDTRLQSVFHGFKRFAQKHPVAPFLNFDQMIDGYRRSVVEKVASKNGQRNTQGETLEVCDVDNFPSSQPVEEETWECKDWPSSNWIAPGTLQKVLQAHSKTAEETQLTVNEAIESGNYKDVAHYIAAHGDLAPNDESRRNLATMLAAEAFTGISKKLQSLLSKTGLEVVDTVRSTRAL